MLIILFAEERAKKKSGNEVRKKAKIRNRYNQVSHLTQDTTLESDKNTRKLHIQESQEVIPFPASDTGLH